MANPEQEADEPEVELLPPDIHATTGSRRRKLEGAQCLYRRECCDRLYSMDWLGSKLTRRVNQSLGRG
eukprot:483166-Pleurochrysis_carterae.AAC.1